MHSKLRVCRIIYACAFMIIWTGLSASPSRLAANVIENEADPISGSVTDETGAPLPGATVQIKVTTRGTITDVGGNFSLEVEPDAVLQISYVGYLMQEISVNGQANIAVQLAPDAMQLDELVVVGYGIQKRSDVTGAIASVKTEDFNKGVISNPVDLMQGKMAGVNITSTSGEPGATQNVIIRGIGSLRSGTQPLYVVDGFLLDNSATGVASNPLNFLNPNDIESIDVLKDASATALYGSRPLMGW